MKNGRADIAHLNPQEAGLAAFVLQFAVEDHALAVDEKRPAVFDSEAEVEQAIKLCERLTEFWKENGSPEW